MSNQKSSIFLTSRRNWRGIKICPCGQMNGCRSLACSNPKCELGKKSIEEKKSLDPILLKSYISNSKIYSLRSKEREFAPRNFVQITETTLLSESKASCIVNRNAICFIDTCKYDSTDLSISCKHVERCLSSSKNAIEFKVNREVLWNLKIAQEEKIRLWEMYKDDEMTIPSVQCISSTTFVVKCIKSQSFPAGRLHVTALSNNNKNKISKKGTYSCACKKLRKSVPSADAKEEICDHLILVLAAVLSKSDFSITYENFTAELKRFWHDEAAYSREEDNLSSSTLKKSSTIKCNTKNSFSLENLDSAIDLDDAIADDDIFIFDNELLEDISDFPANIVKSITEFQNYQKNSIIDYDATNLHHQMDPNMVSSCCSPNNSNASLETMMPISIENICSTVNENDGTELQFSDCNIELMDEFQLTDHIDLCNEDIILSNSAPFHGTDIMTPYENGSDVLIKNNCLQLSPIAITNGQQMLPMTIFDQNTVNLIKTSVVKPIIVEATKQPEQKKLKSESENKSNHIPDDPGPALGYCTWLEFVIETINMSVDIQTNEPNVFHTFNVHEEVFAHFSKRFSTGVKRRIPTSTCVVKKGKYKGFIKYTYVFYTAYIVQRIFQTQNMAIQIERYFEQKCDGYIPFVKKKLQPLDNTNNKRIYQKLSLYTAYILFDCSDVNHKMGFKIEWIPNVLPKSRFGIMNIEFKLGFKLQS